MTIRLHRGATLIYPMSSRLFNVIPAQVHRRQLKGSRRVGKGALRRAHHNPTSGDRTLVGTSQGSFAHPTSKFDQELACTSGFFKPIANRKSLVENALLTKSRAF